MILQALTEYYEALLEKGDISSPGWDDAGRVGFGLDISEGGEIINLIPYQRNIVRGKKDKLVPKRIMRIPSRVKRSSGVAANFLCDTASYIFGYDSKCKEDERSLKRARKCFEAGRALHYNLLKDIDEPAARAILNFYNKWDPASALTTEIMSDVRWKEVINGVNIIFCFNMEPVSKYPAIAAAWQQYYSAVPDDAETGQCLVTGRTGPVARTHPSIKGVQGAQSSGASLVSFNAPAYDSYGHHQGGNAPVSEYAAFAYTSALNFLLADREHCRTIGDTTVVCWARHAQSEYQDIGMDALFGGSVGIDDQNLSAILNKLAKGESCSWRDISLEPDEHFYFLGLAPNASRLSVRFFLQDSFGRFMSNIERHYRDTAIIKPGYDNRENIPLWQLLNETVNKNSRDKAASPQMTGSVLMSVLTGTRYPATLLNGAELRIRAERDITRGRAAIIKAYYLRYQHQDCPEEVLQMELNENSTNIAYALGRLFSVYEQIQHGANPDINTTIKDKYFNSASATPAIIFPILGNLAQKHLRVIRRQNYGQAVNLEKKIGVIMEVIGKEFPARLTLPQQGSFQLGYYLENQKRYTKKEDRADE